MIPSDEIQATEMKLSACCQNNANSTSLSRGFFCKNKEKEIKSLSSNSEVIFKNAWEEARTEQLQGFLQSPWPDKEIHGWMDGYEVSISERLGNYVLS